MLDKLEILLVLLLLITRIGVLLGIGYVIGHFVTKYW